MAYIDKYLLMSKLQNLTNQGDIDYLGVYDCVNSVPIADVVEVERKPDTEIKQIEEMALCMKQNRPNLYFFSSDAEKLGKKLYELGYRKQSEGEWIYHECVSSYEGAISGYSCSVCSAFVDEEVFETDEFHKKHCGNCGAKMDGGKVE